MPYKSVQMYSVRYSDTSWHKTNFFFSHAQVKLCCTDVFSLRKSINSNRIQQSNSNWLNLTSQAGNPSNAEVQGDTEVVLVIICCICVHPRGNPSRFLRLKKKHVGACLTKLSTKQLFVSCCVWERNVFCSQGKPSTSCWGQKMALSSDDVGMTLKQSKQKQRAAARLSFIAAEILQGSAQENIYRFVINCRICCKFVCDFRSQPCWLSVHGSVNQSFERSLDPPHVPRVMSFN